MSNDTLGTMIDGLITKLEEIGYCVRTGMNMECCRFDPIEPPAGITPQHRMDALILQRSGDSKRHNLLFCTGGPSMYAQHQILEDRWAITAAWADDMKVLFLSSDESQTHSDVITALNLTCGVSTD